VSDACRPNEAASRIARTVCSFECTPRLSRDRAYRSERPVHVDLVNARAARESSCANPMRASTGLAHTCTGRRRTCTHQMHTCTGQVCTCALRRRSGSRSTSFLCIARRSRMSLARRRVHSHEAAPGAGEARVHRREHGIPGQRRRPPARCERLSAV
jgi:hypothetical protein